MIDDKCHLAMWPLKRSAVVESIEKMVSTVFKVKHKEQKAYLEYTFIWTLYHLFGNLKTNKK